MKRRGFLKWLGIVPAAVVPIPAFPKGLIKDVVVPLTAKEIEMQAPGGITWVDADYDEVLGDALRSMGAPSKWLKR